MRDRAAAQAVVRNLYTPGGSAFHAWLTPAEFTSRFNPTSGQAESVASYLRQQGLTNVAVEPNHLIVRASGSAARVEAAFHTSIRATQSNGQLLYGNVTPALVPEKFHGQVIAVLGLYNVHHMRTHIVKMQRAFVPIAASMRAPATTAAGTPPPCFEVVNGVCILGEFGPTQYQTAYDANAKQCSNNCTGANTAVAVMAEGNVAPVLTDLRAAETFWGLPKVAYAVRKVGVASTDTYGAVSHLLADKRHLWRMRHGRSPRNRRRCDVRRQQRLPHGRLRKRCANRRRRYELGIADVDGNMGPLGIAF